MHINDLCRGEFIPVLLECLVFDFVKPGAHWRYQLITISFVTEIIQHVEYSVPMARVAEIAQNATAHWGNLLTPTVTSDAHQLS
jgi:hypothetical protein